MTWVGKQPPPKTRVTFLGCILALVRAVCLALAIFFGFLMMKVLRLIEIPFFGQSRPITPYITKIVCSLALKILGLRCRVCGRPMQKNGAIVANHTSWLDIFVLNAVQTVYFVSKTEVANWPFIGQLAKITGTVFIDRNPRSALDHRNLFVTRLQSGHRLLFFPEGTSTDGQQVLEFKSTLFAAFFKTSLKEHSFVQAVSIFYHAPRGEDLRFYGWWGDMSFGKHMLQTLMSLKSGAVYVVFSEPLAVIDFVDRKSLTVALHSLVELTHRKSRNCKNHPKETLM